MNNFNSLAKVSHKLNLVSGNCLQVQINIQVGWSLSEMIEC